MSLPKTISEEIQIKSSTVTYRGLLLSLYFNRVFLHARELLLNSMVRLEKKNCSETEDGIDRISNLPDVVLEHILSFLSTKEAVGTCILSKRWKSTWACVPVLDINLEEFRGYTYEERGAKFERFVKGVLQNREPSNLEKLKLVCYAKDCASLNSRAIGRCILQAMKFKPQVLYLSVSKPEISSFDTDPIFTCASLHDVILEQNYWRRDYLEIAPSSVHLPCLKKLHLTHVTVNDDSIDKLFFGCPILEELFLHDCNLNVYKISSDKLKKLVLLDCILEQYLKISTPVLLELEVRRCGREKISWPSVHMAPIGKFSLENNIASLVNARIDFPYLYYADEYAGGGFKLLTSLSNITSLDLQLNHQLRVISDIFRRLMGLKNCFLKGEDAQNSCSETDDAIDRISNLPDVLLEHILSFLSTKKAVETCILSKRWKSTWAYVPVLDINLEEFRGRTYKEREAKFQQFVIGVLQNREPSNLKKFKLVWYTKDCPSFNSGALESCILQAIKFKPRVLSLYVSKPALLSFDIDPIFTCASLHDVMLEQNSRHHYLEVAPRSVHLLCLKKLHLTRVTVNDDSVDKLLFGCPILEVLFLQNCILNVYKISSEKLKKLVLLECCLEQYLEVSTPVLLELEVRSCGRKMLSWPWVYITPIGIFLLENIASLINARIEFPAWCYADDEFPEFGFKLLISLSNITSLNLHLHDPRLRGLLEKEVSNCPIFKNLKTLILGGWCMSRHFELVFFFLRSPNLRSLTLYYEPIRDWDDDTDEKSSPEEARGALFQREQLEIVKIIKCWNYLWLINDTEYIDRLLNKLHAHVKTIGKTIITNSLVH